jgi:hypothetical protein
MKVLHLSGSCNLDNNFRMISYCSSWSDVLFLPDSKKIYFNLLVCG